MTDTATLEKRVEVLRALAAVGKTYNEISDIMGLPYQNVYAMARTNNITVIRKSKVDTFLPDIKRLAESGMGITAISAQLGISEISVRGAAKKHGIDISDKAKVESLLPEIKKLAEAGANLADIAAKTGLSEAKVRTAARKNDINIAGADKIPVDKISPKRLERLAEVERLFVKEKMSSADIARKFGISREMIRQDLALMDFSPRAVNAEQRKKNADAIRVLAEEGLTTAEIEDRTQINAGAVRNIAKQYGIEIARIKAVAHGTFLSYQRGCNCQPCKDVNTAKAREDKKRRIEKGVPDHLHGTPSAYSNWDCRCAPCTAAGAEANRLSTLGSGNESRNHAQWTAEEDAMVLDYNYTARELADLLERTVSAVNGRRHKLNDEAQD